MGFGKIVLFRVEFEDDVEDEEDEEDEDEEDEDDEDDEEEDEDEDEPVEELEVGLMTTGMAPEAMINAVHSPLM